MSAPPKPARSGPSPPTTSTPRRRPPLGTEWHRVLRADPVRRFLVTASAIVLLPTLLLAWTAGNLVARRVTEHVAQAGSAEVAANAAAVMRQSGLAASSSGHAVVVFSVPERVPSAWQYFETVARRNPNTRGVQVYDAGGRSEEHTSELQSRENLVCRLLL